MYKMLQILNQNMILFLNTHTKPEEGIVHF